MIPTFLLVLLGLLIFFILVYFSIRSIERRRRAPEDPESIVRNAIDSDSIPPEEVLTDLELEYTRKRLIDLTITEGESCKLITDPELLKQWNHEEPLLEISNQYCSTVIPISRITLSRLEYAFQECNRARVDWIMGIVLSSIRASRGDFEGLLTRKV